jgi:transcriptional regulator with XRE-family HTH domain
MASTSTPQPWTAEHQRLLQQARVDAGVSEATFARDNTITLRQLQQLEQGGSSAFYSESIQYALGVKLLKRLGVPASTLATLQPDVQLGITSPPQRVAHPHARPGATSADDERQPASDRKTSVGAWRLVLVIVGLALIVIGLWTRQGADQPAAMSTSEPTRTEPDASPAVPVAPVPPPPNVSRPAPTVVVKPRSPGVQPGSEWPDSPASDPPAPVVDTRD